MKTIITDASTAVGSVAYKLSQIIPIYPITPSSPMAECANKVAKIYQALWFNVFIEYTVWP